MKKGHFVYIPHLSHYVHLELDMCLGTEYWYNFDLAFLEMCDAIYMLPGWKESKGATLERKKAEEWIKKIYYNLDDIPLSSMISGV